MQICKYFTHLTGFVPTEDQKSFLLDIVDPDIKKLAASAGCQSGKTLCSSVGTLWWIFESDQRVNILLISAQDSILYHHIREIFKKHPELTEQLTGPFSPNLIPFRGFEILSGNQVFVRGSTEKQVSGIPANIVFLDEACLIKDDIILESMNRLTLPIAKLVLLSTPSNSRGLFVKWVTDSKSGFKVHQWSSEGLSWHDQTIDATKKKEFSRAKYAIYMLGRPPSAEERTYFPGKHVDLCVKESVDREGGKESRLEAGIDFGFDPCKTVLIITEKLFARRKVLFVKSWSKQPIEVIAPEIGSIINKFGVSIIKADAKPAEYKGKIESYIKPRIVHYIEAPIHKEQMLAQLQRKVRQHTLEVDEKQVSLIVEMKKYRRGKRTGDDLVDALALSCYEPQVPLSSRPSGMVIFPKDKARSPMN